MVYGSPDNIKKLTLPNGMVVLGEVLPAARSAALGFFIKTGSRDEMAGEAGLSHFLEHMMFRGTQLRDGLTLTFDLGKAGAQSNAFTSEEATVYYGTVAAEKFSEFLEILTEMMQPALHQEDFNTEKNVILEEIALYLDRPFHFLCERAFQHYFGEHPAGNSVLGSRESVSALTRDQMASYLQRRYRPAHMVAVATGQFPWEFFSEYVATHFGSLPSEPAQRLRPFFRHTVGGAVYEKANLQQGHTLLLGPGCSLQDERRFAQGILMMALGDVTGSRLYWDLVHSGLAESATCGEDERDQLGCVYAYASTEPEKLDEVTSRMRNILSLANTITNDEIERAKNKFLARTIFRGEVPVGRLYSLGLGWLAREETDTLAETIAKIKGVTRADILELLEESTLTSWSEYRLLPRVE